MRNAKLRNANLLIGEEKEPIRRSAFPGEAPSELVNSVDGTSDKSSWHSRGYLPHFTSRTVIQHVTFHLADSLPKGVLDNLSEEISRLPLERRDAEKRKRIEAWIDAGHGDCALGSESIAEAVQNALLYFDGQRYRMLAWVVMPNHVHTLFQPLDGWTVAKIVSSWKKFTARKILEYRQKRSASPGNAPWNADLPIGSFSEPIRRLALPGLAFPGGLPASAAGAAGVWHREYWDRFIRDINHYRQTVEYIHLNPVKAGLAAKAESWPWSSAAKASR